VYSSCLFCHARFGANDAIEHLPVGRRIAYDAAHGRLWLVCRNCGRWNLTPFDERWEAIEECERHFVITRLRVFSDNVGLARLDEGLELVRIGRPLRPELAAWRYGSTLERRHQRRRQHVLGRLGGYGMVAAGPVMALVGGPIGMLAYVGAAVARAVGRHRTAALKIGFENGEALELSVPQIQNALLIRDDTIPEGWAIMVEHLGDTGASRWPSLRNRFDSSEAILMGPDARRAATFLLPCLNPIGGDAEAVSDALHWLEAAGGPERAFRTFTRARFLRPALESHRTRIATMHAGVRLALEMALHEEEERRALAGELSILEWAWKYEERFASIADRLGLPDWIQHRLISLHQPGG
jgi:hypothetical protein